MKTKITLLFIIFAGLFGGVNKAYGCFTLNYETIYTPDEEIHGSLQTNYRKVWFIWAGQGRRTQIQYSAQLPTTTGYSRFFIYDVPSTYYSPYQLLPYDINPTDPNILVQSMGGDSRGVVTTSPMSSGWCAIVLHVSNAGNGAYDGIRFSYSTLLDSTIVTNSNVTIMGNQSVMDKLGIGTDAPQAPLHIQTLPVNNHKIVSSYQGEFPGYKGGTSLYFNNYLGSNGYPVYVQGAVIDNADATPQTLSSWIVQDPQNKSVSIGGAGETFFEARSRRILASGTDFPGDILIGADDDSHPTGEGYRLNFLGVKEGRNLLYISRYNVNADTCELRVNLGGYTPSGDGRFVVGYGTDSKDWRPLFTIAGSGSVGIGVEPKEKLHVAGNIKADTIKAASLQLTGTNMSTTNFGSIGIGLPAGRTPNAPLQVFQQQILSSALNNATPIATFGGETKTSGGQNNFNNRLWLRRASSGGADWTTAGLHDAISVDNSYGTPGSNTRTWWERMPGAESSGGTQSWGDRNVTYMTLKGDKLGIGTNSPTEKLVLYNGTALQTATQYTNASTAIGSDKGFIVGIEAAGNGLVFHRNNTFIRFGTNATEHMRILGNGNIGIGTTAPTKKLEVNGDIKAGNLTATGATIQGTIEAQKVIITKNVTGADFVFASDYNLPELQAVEEHIKEHQHLPEIPSAAEMAEKGVDMVELNIKLLQKVEELTLYIIDQNKRIEKQNQDISTLTEEVNSLKSK